MTVKTKTIPDNKLIHIWISENGERAEVGPDWYEEHGTPVDSDGDDMQYSHTEMVID